jgi:23S rRNA (guanine2445-N2)-methyltransferase / 23S rRNA (guanine2069-N7)-methyltransferase
MTFEFFATVPQAMESLLANELKGLGAQGVKEKRTGVSFSGSLEVAYRACLWSRLANRVLLRLGEFDAPDTDALYVGTQSVRWPDHLDVNGTLAVDVSLRQSGITNSLFAAQRVKDAVVDQFRVLCGKRPSVNVGQPDLRLRVHVDKARASLSIDLSGDSLHRRGYRLAQGQAPLKENVAAGLLAWADWASIASSGGACVDPMCGSGTIPIEAAWMATDTAPGLARRYFGFLGWRSHEPALWLRLCQEARQRREDGRRHAPIVVGYDVDAQSVRAAIANIERAGLRGLVHIERRDIADCQAPQGVTSGIVIMNPPYGERLGELDALKVLYTQLGVELKTKFPGWTAYVLTASEMLGKRLGLRATRSHQFFNGALPCRLLCVPIRPAAAEREQSTEPAMRTSPAVAGPHGPFPPSGDTMFANRLAKNLKRLRPWAKRHGISCFRVYDADLPEFAVAIDVYEQWVHVQEYEAPATINALRAAGRLRGVMAQLPDLLDVPKSHVTLKIRRRKWDRSQYPRFDAKEKFHEVREGDCRFLINLSDYLDTGLFLDHRRTRALIQTMAKGTRFLNLFGYTGTASVYAAKGGARSTVTVDMSKTYLAWAEKNYELNGLSRRTNSLIEADCLVWLEAAHGSFDLMFLDPPTFSNSKRMRRTFDVQRDHAWLIKKAMKLLAPGGTMIFSSNFRRFKMDATTQDEFEIQDITRATIDADFSRSPRIHHCFRIRAR